MDSGQQSPLVDLVRRGEAARDMCLLAARGLLPVKAHEQIALLVVLVDHADPEIAAQANATIGRLPPASLSAFLAREDVPQEIRVFFAQRQAPAPAAMPAQATDAVAAAAAADSPSSEAEGGDGGEEAEGETRILSGLPVAERLKYAMKGTREQRGQLIRDSNKIVAAAVLSSPKLTEAEVEAFCKMGNVSEDVLRLIGSNRTWLKNYGVIHGLVRNPKTPPAMSMHMMHRLTEKDVKMLTVDRNVPEALRLAARRMLVKAKKD